MTHACKIVKGYANHSRQYHTKVGLTDRSCECSQARDAGAFCRLIAELPGVANVFVSRYELTVFKGQAFTWDEVEPGIIEILEHLVDPTVEKADERR